jgi:hypothetical protein
MQPTQNAKDMLPGNWSTAESPVSSDGAITGTSRTEKILNGCALWEHRFVEKKGKELFDAHIVLGHDVTTKKMLLFYVDDGSHTQVYEGRRESGGVGILQRAPWRWRSNDINSGQVRTKRQRVYPNCRAVERPRPQLGGGLCDILYAEVVTGPKSIE